MSKKKYYNSDKHSAEDRALDRFASMMVEKIKAIQSDWKKPWFSKDSHWPRNLQGREYNGANALFLMLYCAKLKYKNPVFGTFERFTSLNYDKKADGSRTTAKDKNGEELPMVRINKGETSFPVFITTLTCVEKTTREKVKYEDFLCMSDEQKKKYTIYTNSHVYNVFNVAQTNIKEARPELFAKIESGLGINQHLLLDNNKFSFPAVDSMIDNNKWVCPIRLQYGDECFYRPSDDIIVVPEKKQFRDGESFYSNLFHEMAHSTGAENRLGRIKNSEYSKEELVAELSAALVSNRYGIEKHITDDSAAYLKHWVKNLQESPEFIKTVMTDVKKASSMITKHIDEEKQSLNDTLKKTDIKIDKNNEKDMKIADTSALTDYMKSLRDKNDIFSGDENYLPDPLFTAYAKFETTSEEYHIAMTEGLLNDKSLQTLKDNANNQYKEYSEKLREAVKEYREASEQTMINPSDKLNGLYEKRYDNGQLAIRANYKDGKWNGLSETWYENGQQAVRTNYINGKKNGLSETWYENGQQAVRANYKDGKLDGLRESWYDDGKRSLRTMFKNDERNGLHETWYVNGNIGQRIHYKNDKKDGLSEYWAYDGTPLKKNYFNYHDGSILDKSKSELEHLSKQAQAEGTATIIKKKDGSFGVRADGLDIITIDKETANKYFSLTSDFDKNKMLTDIVRKESSQNINKINTPHIRKI